jgi:hypothetical protein
MKVGFMEKHIAAGLVLVLLLVGGCKDKEENKHDDPNEQVVQKAKMRIWGNAFNGPALSRAQEICTGQPAV